jgi:divalent metal cation (Fe/Co/Zn/Cd) transporter
MIKLACSIFLMVVVFMVFLFWLAGSHGHLQLRFYMAEDWIMAGIMAVCFVSSILFFAFWLRAKKRRNGGK